jgi:hypothetical protein
MKTTLIAVLLVGAALTDSNVYAMSHHGGHRGGKKPRGAVCVKPRLEKFIPANMGEIAPGGQFSFVAFNIENPDDLMVSAKNLPVKITTEYKAPYYVVTGKLPTELRNTVARLNVMVHGKGACELDSGWLVKITE